jgi:phosphatidylinositol alpha-1,6-mannosyltransferase
MTAALGVAVAPRVLFLLTEVCANGGIQRFNQTILDSCGRLGIQCQVLSLNDSPASIAETLTPGNPSIVGFSGDRLRFAIAVAGALLRNRHDRVFIGHINFLMLAVGVLALRPLNRPPTMLVAHGIEVWSGIGRARRYALSRVTGILCVSNYTRRRILEQAPALIADRLIRFPNALADTWGRVVPAPPTRSLPARFILSVTRLDRGDRYKGIATVIEAFSMLADDSMEYFVVGRGNDLSFLQLVAERCGVKDRVHFMSGVSDSELIALYEKCEVFVLPSGKEGFGIVFLEAMFFGAPVIAASERGALDVIEDGDTGLLVRFGDCIALKRAIERLASDPPLRDRLRKRARATVIGDGEFTFSRFTARTAEEFALSSGAA